MPAHPPPSGLCPILGSTDLIHILDVGASIISSSEVPVYRTLLDLQLGILSAFDGDPLQISKIKEEYGATARVFQHFVYDGNKHQLYVMHPTSGLTSLLEPDPNALSFFNGFSGWAQVLDTRMVQTVRLDDIDELTGVDFVKIDAQGSELTVLMNGVKKLEHCVAVQLEVSFIQLYKNQPSFGEIDLWMRSQGYLPHRFQHIKRWSIAPILFQNDVRIPGNQLLEADIVYIREPLRLGLLTAMQLRKLAILSHHCFGSVDLCTRVILELVRRQELAKGSAEQYAHLINQSLAPAKKQ